MTPAPTSVSASASASTSASVPAKPASPATRLKAGSEPPKSVILRKFVAAAAVAAAAVLLLLLLNLSYLYGSFYRQAERGAGFHILLVDYDGGVVGRSLSSAYQHLKSPSFPTLLTHPPSQYPSSDAVIQAVRNRQYWAAIFTSQNASQRLSAALQGGSAATNYDPTEALTYVWNGVRHPATAESVIESSFVQLVDATRLAYNSINGTQALATLAQNDPAAVHVYLDPIDANSVNINQMPQGTKVLYNTISMAMPILQQLFFVLALNGMSARFRIYNDFHPRTSGVLRGVVSAVYTLVGAVTMTGYIWAFREDWPVHGYQFVETWMLLWLLMHIYFCLIDALTAVLPQPAMPFVIVTWIIVNISATISPFEITPGFYRWGYALPAHSAYDILTYIWSSGPAPELHRALPILFAWWLLGLACAILAHRRRCRRALSTGGSGSSSAESPLHKEELDPERTRVASSGDDECTQIAKDSITSQAKQPDNEKQSISEKKDTRTDDTTASGELAHQLDRNNFCDQRIDHTSLYQEESKKSKSSVTLF